MSPERDAMIDNDPQEQSPVFIITIDTEGDNMWQKPREIQTRNVRYLPRFQALCERFQLKPVYLTDWEMVEDPAYREFAADVIARRTGEIGMHLHAWNTPPIVPLTSDDYTYHPYLIEYPEAVLREKVHVMTATLQERFQQKMSSHRAGRWAFNGLYGRALLDEGYVTDCSVTPHVSWRSTMGDPGREGGSDYTSCSESAYWLDMDDISRAGSSSLLEVPVSIVRNPALPHSLEEWTRRASGTSLVGRAVRRIYPSWIWLRPNGANLRHMLSILTSARKSMVSYVEFMLHSSELMPGGSPTFPTEKSIEKLYLDLEELFAASQKHFRGATLAEYSQSSAVPGKITSVDGKSA
jgi:hypothetical protein